MPLYQYKCSDTGCNHLFEKLVKMSDRDEQNCTRCEKKATRDGFQGFTVNTPLDTTTKKAHTTKEIDRVIGASAAKKWESFEKKTQAKLEGANVVQVAVKPGEKFNPEALIGDAKRRKRSEIYAEAVSDHKELAVANGQDPNHWDKSGFKKVDI